MNKKELLELIKTGEGYTLEFKESFSNSIAKEICAFSNSSGGKILLGVNDKGNIIGFNDSNRIRSQIQDIGRNIEPPIDIQFEMIDNIGVITVLEGKDKPYLSTGRFYLRQGANSQRLNRVEIDSFLKNNSLISFEDQINKKFSLRTNFNKHKFNSFISKANIPNKLGIKHILNNLNLLTDNKPNNACVLLFCNRITDFFLSADISCVLYGNENKTIMLDKKVFNSDFISNFENTILFILRNIRTKAEIKGLRRIETPEISEEALREAVINAMIHRNYFIESRILVNIFKSKVEIINPGKLLFDKKELGKISINRNPIIADCMLRANIVEKIGSGIKRIKELAPNTCFETNSNWFIVTFPRNTDLENAGISAGISAGIKLTKLQENIIEFIKNDSKITANKLSKLLNKDIRTIERNLTKLVNFNCIKRIGSRKEGYWKLQK